MSSENFNDLNLLMISSSPSLSQFNNFLTGYTDTAILSEKETLLLEIQSVQKQVDQLIHLSQAAMKIQKFYKSYYYRFYGRHVQAKAATSIQRQYRRHLLHKKSRPSPDQAANRIRRAYFSYRFRSSVRKYRCLVKCAWIIRDSIKSKEARLASEYGLRWKSHCFARRFMRQEIIDKFKKTYYTHKLNAFLRRAVTKYRLRKLDQKIQLDRERYLSLKYGHRWLHVWSSKKLLAFKGSIDVLIAIARKGGEKSKKLLENLIAQKIQKIWKQKLHDNNLKRQEIAAQLQLAQDEAAKEKARQLEILNRAALKLQRNFRRFQHTRRFSKMRRLVVRVQAAWRAYLARQRFARLKIDYDRVKLLTEKSEILSAFLKKESDKYLINLVTRCQAMWRAKFFRRKIVEEQHKMYENYAIMNLVSLKETPLAKHLHRSASKIQVFYRKFKDIKDGARFLWAVSKLQANFRRKFASRNFEKYKTLERQTMVIQAMLKKDSDLLKDLLARKVQAIWRGFIPRRKLQISDRKRQLELLNLYRPVNEREMLVNTSEISETIYPNPHVILIPRNIEGILREGRFISGPLKGAWLRDIGADEWTHDEIYMFHKRTMERAIDIEKAVIIIQAFYRGIKRIQALDGNDGGEGSSVAKRSSEIHHRMLNKYLHIKSIRLDYGQYLSVNNELQFDPNFIGSNVSIIFDRLGIAKIDSEQDNLLSSSSSSPVVVIPVAMKETSNQICFEVLIEDILKDGGGDKNSYTDGLTMGFTDKLPDEILPNSCDELPGNLYLIGFDGHGFIVDEFYKTDFNPVNLSVGDRVSVSIVYPDGDLLYIVNNEIVAVIENCNIPRGVKLYPVIELLGNCRSVSLVNYAEPPDIVQGQGAEGKGERQGEAGNEGKEESEEMEHDSEELRAYTMGKFLNMERSSDNSVKFLYTGSKDPANYEGFGVVVSTSSSKYIEVRVIDQSPGFSDGLTIGFLSSSDPEQSMEEVDFCDGLNGDSWLLGFDGKYYSNGKFVESPWCGNTLKEGDKVGLLMINGDLLLFVNEEIVCEIDAKIPSDLIMHAVIDLIGGTNSVLFIENPNPPEIELAS
jgi:Neuralized/IQ calmodulin-binding motif